MAEMSSNQLQKGSRVTEMAISKEFSWEFETSTLQPTKPRNINKTFLNSPQNRVQIVVRILQIQKERSNPQFVKHFTNFRQKHFRTKFFSRTDYFSEISKNFRRNFQEFSRKFREFFQKFSRIFLEISKNFLRNF